MKRQLVVLSLLATISAQSDKALAAAVSDPSPSIVAPGVISQDDRYEFGSVLSEDGAEFFIGVDHGGWASIELYVRSGEHWRHSRRVIGNPDFSANDPFLSPDGTRLYFITKENGSFEIGYIERLRGEGWSLPVIESAPINSAWNEYYISFLRNGDMVFASDRNAKEVGDFDIYLARRRGDAFEEPRPFPEGINTDGYEADAFIDPGGEYLIFSSNRDGGRGRGDLYVTFTAEDSNWTQPQPLNAVNTEGHELCPFVSADGSTLYFTREGDIYSVDISAVTSLRPR